MKRTKQSFVQQNLIAFLTLNILAAYLAEGNLLKLPQDMTVVEGQTIRLECETDLDLPVYWYHNGKEIFAGGEVALRYKLLYNVTKEIPGEYDLAIESATQSHNGVYTCGDDEGAGEKRSAYVKVTEPTVTLHATLPSTTPMYKVLVKTSEVSKSLTYRTDAPTQVFAATEESEYAPHRDYTTVPVASIVVPIAVIVIAAIFVALFLKRGYLRKQREKPSAAENEIDYALASNQLVVQEENGRRTR